MRFVLATGIFPPEIGGPATVIFALANDLRAKGHAVTVVTYGEKDETTSEIVRVSRRGSVLSRYVRFARAVRRLVTKDAIILATDVFSVGIPVRSALVGKRNRFILRLGGEWCWEDVVEKKRTAVPLRTFWQTGGHGVRSFFQRWNYRWILSRTQKVVVTSDLLRDVLRIVVPSLKTDVVTLTNVPSGTCAHPRSADGPHDPLRLLYVGRFARVKNVVFFARVLEQAVTRGVRVACTFIGTGPDLAEAQGVLSGVPQMRFLGALSHEDVLGHFSDADLLALPSLTDICPNIVGEALACGVPVIMTSEHGLPSGFCGIIERSPLEEDAWISTLASLQEKEVYERLRSSIRVPESSSVTLVSVLERV